MVSGIKNGKTDEEIQKDFNKVVDTQISSSEKLTNIVGIQDSIENINNILNGNDTEAILSAAELASNFIPVAKAGKYFVKVGDKLVEVTKKSYDKISDTLKRVEIKVDPNTLGMNGGNIKVGLRKEIVLPSANDYNQARNQAQNILGDLGVDSKPFIGSLSKSAGNGKVIGRVSADGKKRWRLDYDDKKGLHINVEDFSKGKSADKVIKQVIPIKNGTENDFKNLLKHLNK